MSNIEQIAPLANKIIKKYDLCDHCLGRLFSKQLHLSSNKLLGKKLKKNLNSSGKCYICKNLFDNLKGFSIIPIILFPSEKNEKSAKFLNLELASYSNEFEEFIKKLIELYH